MEEKQQAREQGEWEREKVSVNKSKIAKTKKTRLRMGLSKEGWGEVKMQRKEFAPKFTRLKKDGHIAPSNARPEILADFFAQKQ